LRSTGDFIAHFEDQNGEDVFLRMADVAMLSVPVDAVDASAMPEYDEDPNEPEGAPAAPEPF